jgi:hypothetical protein
VFMVAATVTKIVGDAFSCAASVIAIERNIV